MAIIKSTRYPGRWETASEEYPLGKPKNRTSATSKDGTYFEKDWLSDYEAFFGAIITKAGYTPSGTVDTALSSQLYNAMAEIFGSPAGRVDFFAMDTAPIGYLAADGSAVSRTQYATLYAAIGETFGSGDGSTTFNLPDMRGEFPRGWDNGRGVDSGRAFGSNQSSANLSHTHGYSGTTSSDTHSHTFNKSTGGGGTGSYINQESSDSLNGTFSTNSDTHNHSFSGTTDSTGDTESRPRNVALLACIKY